ncbi:hypothetical protein FS749_000595 [Ceratobasidium sp. UAMH 11750]|nr:hypothetical protein FS749_000595 [Ceratobasidium sp. UAMH 11750]
MSHASRAGSHQGQPEPGSHPPSTHPYNTRNRIEPEAGASAESSAPQLLEQGANASTLPSRPGSSQSIRSQRSMPGGFQTVDNGNQTIQGESSTVQVFPPVSLGPEQEQAVGTGSILINPDQTGASRSKPRRIHPLIGGRIPPLGHTPVGDLTPTGSQLPSARQSQVPSPHSEQNHLPDVPIKPKPEQRNKPEVQEQALVPSRPDSVTLPAYQPPSESSEGSGEEQEQAQ